VKRASASSGPRHKNSPSQPNAARPPRGDNEEEGQSPPLLEVFFVLPVAVAACAVLAGASDGITDNDIDLAKRVEGLV